MNATRLEPGAVGELAQDEEGSCTGERTAARVQEELVTVAAVEVRAAQREVPANRLRGWAPERDEPFLPALAENAYDAVFYGDAVLLEPDRLRHPKAGAVEELHEGAISQSTRSGADRGVDQPFGLRRRQRAR